MVPKLYLDNCCFNRPYDDQSFIRIRIETESKLYIQNLILENKYRLVWSYILDFENSQNPFEFRKKEIFKWRFIATEQINETEGLILRAENLIKLGIKSKDSLHISCAIEAECDYFITTDDKLLNKVGLIKNILITSPVRFIESLGVGND